MRTLLEMDNRLSRRLRLAERPGIWRIIAMLLAHSGDSWFWLAGLGLVWFVGSARWREQLVTMIAGILVTAVLVMLIKFTVRRRRPEGEWGRIYRNTDPHSFPSGHAARAAMLAILAVGLGTGWLGISLLVWAPLVGLARVAMGVHYLSDIVAGMALGAVLGAIILLV